MANKKPYLPNHWQAIKDTPTDQGKFPAMSFEQVMDWKVLNWALPSSHDCIVRATHIDTKKVTEWSYQRRGYAQKKIMDIMQKGTHEFVLLEHDDFTNLYPIEQA